MPCVFFVSMRLFEANEHKGMDFKVFEGSRMAEDLERVRLPLIEDVKNALGRQMPALQENIRWTLLSNDSADFFHCSRSTVIKTHGSALQGRRTHSGQAKARRTW